MLKFAGAAGACLSLPGFTTNAGATSMGRAARMQFDTDVLVIGGGMAGVLAALSARRAALRVTLVDKGVVGSSGMSPWAASVARPDMGFAPLAEVMEDLARDSEFLNDRLWTGLHLQHAPRVFADLERWGLLNVPGLRRGPGLLALLRSAQVELLERVMVTSFLREAGGRVSGAVGFTFDDSHADCRSAVITAKVVISCMGSGSLRAPGSPLWGQTHDGDALAYAVGARITGKEFHDLHPAFDAAALVDGAGGRYRSAAVPSLATFPANRPGRGLGSLTSCFRAMQGEVNTAADSAATPTIGEAPSDDLNGVVLPGSTLGLGGYKGEGVVSSSHTGAADGVPGLFVAGDALGSMFAGPLPPWPGTSLLASAVQGDIVGSHAAAAARQVPHPDLDRDFLEEAIRGLWSPRERPQGYTPAWVTQVAQQAVMPFFVSYVKHAARLEAALSTVTYLRTHCEPKLIAKDGHELRLAHETGHLLLNQEMKLRAALFRQESRGSHYREDFPARDDVRWWCWVDLVQGGTGTMHAVKRPIPEAWRPRGDYLERYPRRFPGESARLAEGSAARAGAP